MSNIPTYYESGHTDYAGSNLAPYDSRFFNVLRAVRTHTPQGGTILDVGCGDMYFASQLTGYKVMGFDLDTSRASGIVKCDLTKPPYPASNASFDTIICSEVLEHLWEPELCLSELHRLVKPGGHLLVTVPNFDALDARLDDYRHLLYRKDNTFSVEHIRQYNPGNLLRLLEAAGFEAISLIGNSPQLSPFFQEAREQLQRMVGVPQIEADAMLGVMFPKCLPGMLMAAQRME